MWINNRLTLFVMCLLPASVQSCINNLSTKVKTYEESFTIETIDGLKYYLFPPCSDTLFGHETQNSIRGNGLWQLGICDNRILFVDSIEIKFYWNNRQHAFTTSRKVSWDTTSYPVDTYFIWYGGVDSISFDGLILLTRTSNYDSPTLQEFQIEQDNSGLLIKTTDNNFIYRAPKNYGKWKRT